MKKVLLSLLVTVIVLSLSAQTKSGYVPFHQYFLNNRGDIQKNNANSRDISYSEIAFMHYAPINDSNWIYSDSGQFYFSQVISNSSPVYETGGNYYQFNSTKWANSSKFTSTADTLGLPLTVTGQTYDTAGGGTWVNSYLYTNTYNSINYLESQLYQTWNTGSWADSTQYSYTYSSGNNDSVVVIQHGSVLENDTQYLYTYNGYNNTGIITQVWSGSAWTNLYKQSNSFDANGNNYQSFVTVWNGTGWNNYALIIRGFDLNNELVSYVYELWNSGTGTYVNNYQEGYAWVLSNNTQFENYNWDSAANSWVPVSLNTYSFDGNHNVIYEFDQNYTNGVFVNAAQYYYYYQEYTVSDIKKLANDLSISLYPNPCTGNAVINYTAKNAGCVILNTYDGQGTLLSQQKSPILAGENQLQVNLIGYAAGNYLIQVVDGANGESGLVKVTKQ